MPVLPDIAWQVVKSGADIGFGGGCAHGGDVPGCFSK